MFAKSGSGLPAYGSTVPSTVVLIGNLNLLVSPLLNLIVHMILSEPLKGMVWDPRGTKFGIASHLDRLLRANLYAVKALPALLGFLVVSFSFSLCRGS